MVRPAGLGCHEGAFYILGDMPQLASSGKNAASQAPPFRPVRRRPPDLLIYGTAAALVVSALIWVLVRLPHGPSLSVNPVPTMMWCGEFAFIATALSVVTRVLLRKPVPALLVIATLAMWALLPPTLVLASFALLFAGPVSLIVAAPLLLAVAGRHLAARGRVVPAVAVLLPALLFVATVTWLMPRPPQLWVWLIVPGWHVLLGVATLAAAAWDRHVARAAAAKLFLQAG
jgi:hypothetical protein